jgi:hypothetical protein
VRKFKPICAVVAEKALTVPIAPKLMTTSRALLKDDLHAPSEDAIMEDTNAQ